MSKKLTTASAVMTALAAVMAVLLLSITPAFAHHRDDHTQGGGQDSTTTSEEQSSQGAENTPGNDRKEGYEDNSDTPQEPNHGRGSDHDGDADSDPNTAYEDDHTTADAGDNAHPSGKDRSVENGGSGNQGKSESNPDDSKGPMRYEGVQGDDKPGGPGGTDLADQDGNNGCGNDDDFNDDNNGWCGKPKRPTPVKPTDVNKPTCPDGSTMPANGKCETPKTCPNGSAMPADGKCDEVLGGAVGQPKEKGPGRAPNPATPTVDSVLGVRINKAAARPATVAPAAQGAVLPFTGSSNLVPLMAVALMLIAAGALGLRARLSSK